MEGYGGPRKNYFFIVFTLKGCGGFVRTNFGSFFFERMWHLEMSESGQFPCWENLVILKGVISMISTLKGFGGLERTHFQQFPTLEDIVYLKRLIFLVFTFGTSGGLE